MSIKCHSSFAHYHMFHDNHCHSGGNNYGSIFNITNNCGGGCGGGFWGGLGMGLGYGFGNMFGGLFGGFMGGFGNMFGGFGNMLGGFGMPGMLGGFGMGGWGLSSLFGGGGGGSTCSCGCDGKKVSSKDEKDYGKRTPEKEFEDPDNSKIVEYKEKIESAKTVKDLETYIRELDQLKLDLTDNYGDDKNVEEMAIDNLIAKATEKIGKLKIDANPDDDVPPTADDTKIGDKVIAQMNFDDIKEIKQSAYDGYTVEQKNKLKSKIEDLSDDNKKTLLDTADFPEDLKKHIREKAYKGWTCWNGTEDLANIKLQKAVDVYGEINNTIPRPVVQKSDINNGKAKIEKGDKDIYTITIEDDLGTVVYTQSETKDGERIFKSNRNSGTPQEYVLQKNGEEWQLRQYFWHTGYKEEDLTTT